MNPRKHEDIIQNAMELIALHGFHGAPMAMIAKQANVAVGTIYRFFESKDDLITETYDCLVGRLANLVTLDKVLGRGDVEVPIR